MKPMTLIALAFATFVIGLCAWQVRAQDGAPTTQPTTQPADMPAQPPADDGFTAAENGLRYKITQPAGEPKTAQKGDVVMVHYTGKFEDGTVFDTSLKETPAGRVMQVEPFVLTLGQGRVIAGWEQGLVGMKVGEKRTLIIPPALAYGEKGAGGGVIPPNATLVFDIELVGLWRPEAAAGQTAQ